MNEVLSSCFKFRAWDGKRFLYKNFFDVKWYNTDSGGHYIELCDCEHEDYKRLTLMQCTGFQDCNFKYIYDGDIISYYAKHLKVELSDLAGILLKPINKPFCDSFEIDMTSIITLSDEIKVIGNICENPDLKKPKSKRVTV